MAAPSRARRFRTAQAMGAKARVGCPPEAAFYALRDAPCKAAESHWRASTGGGTGGLNRLGSAEIALRPARRRACKRAPGQLAVQE
jgi:hypothetical protein